jgi:PAS domain S-box-containing protein
MFKRFVNPAFFFPWCLVFLISLIWPLSAPAQAQPQVDLTGKNVLVLHSDEGNAPVFVGTDKGLLTTLQSGGISKLNQFSESLKLVRHPGLEHRKLLAEQMRMRYGHRKPDVIITMYPEALEFVLKDCRGVFPDVPILALYLPPTFRMSETDRRIIRHFVKPDIIGTLEIALKLVPGAKRVYVVSGVHEVDKMVEDQTRRDLKKREGQLEFLYLSHMPFEDILATLSSVPPRSIILALAISKDVTGAIHTNPEMVQRLSPISTVPIFGIYDTSLGNGIVGGSLSSFEHIGTRAGQLVLDILGGAKTPDNIPAFLDVPSVPMFDWRQLRHWNLSEDALPKGSIVINKELTLWDFRYYIIGAVAFCLLETALIIFLIVQRRRKKVAEEELNQFFNVSLDFFSVANTDGYFVRLNPAAERILGYTREELMTKQFLEFVHPDDLGRTREAISTLASQQKVFSFENRYRCKDGTYRWLQWSSAPAGKLIYAAARDITERKEAEEATRESERMLRQNEDDLRMLAGRLIYAQEEERSHLARELHDDLAQRLAVFAIDVGRLEQQLMDPPAPIQEELREMQNGIVKISQDIHSLSRQLHPSILDDLGLIKAVESECTSFSKREGIKIVFNYENIPRDIPKDISLSLYRIIQEGLSNISKHACAEHISVSLKGIDHDVLLSVKDDGIGFDSAEVQKQPGLGFSSMRERARLIHGEFSIKSQPERGTVITVRAPLTREGE